MHGGACDVAVGRRGEDGRGRSLRLARLARCGAVWRASGGTGWSVGSTCRAAVLSRGSGAGTGPRYDWIAAAGQPWRLSRTRC